MQVFAPESVAALCFPSILGSLTFVVGLDAISGLNLFVLQNDAHQLAWTKQCENRGTACWGLLALWPALALLGVTIQLLIPVETWSRSAVHHNFVLPLITQFFAGW